MSLAAENRKEVAVQTVAPQTEVMSNPFSSLASFEAAQRMAKALSESTLIPKEYQKNIPNCLIALEISQRLRASALMVMQNLYIVHGKPGWSAQYIISAINSCGKFSPLRFRFDNDKSPTECQAYAIEHKTGETLYGTNITMRMAIDEGWVNKNGSKWKTMPEQMLRYRAASFFGKVYAPEILMGFQTTEEIEDMQSYAGAKPVQSDVVPEKKSEAEVEKPEGQRNPTQSQITRLYSIATSAGVSPGEVKERILKEYGKVSTKDLSIPEYDHFCNELQREEQEKHFVVKEENKAVPPQAPAPSPEPQPQPEPLPAAAELDSEELPWEKYLTK